MTAYTHILDLAKEAEPPADGILSRTIFQDDQIKALSSDSARGRSCPNIQRRNRPCCSS
jgi:hypothetical protein